MLSLIFALLAIPFTVISLVGHSTNISKAICCAILRVNYNEEKHHTGILIPAVVAGILWVLAYYM